MLGGCPDLSTEMARLRSAQEFPQALEGGPGRGGSCTQLFGADHLGSTHPSLGARGQTRGAASREQVGGRAVTSSLGVPAPAWSPFLM